MRNAMCLVFFLTIIMATAQKKKESAQSLTENYRSTDSMSYFSNSTSNKSKRNGSSSISVKNNKTMYKFRASFNDEITADVRGFLQKKFEDLKFSNTNQTTFWTIVKNKEEAFSCKLNEGYVRIYADKEMISKGFQEKLKAIGEELKYVINGEAMRGANDARKEVAKRRLAHAKREYERAKRYYEKTTKVK